MSRLSIISKSNAQSTVEELYKDLERRIIASPPGLCPIDMASSFLKLCHAQTCGKCVPCRVGLGQLEEMLEDVLNGDADLSIIDLIEETARSIYYSSDCAIGFEAAFMVLKGVRGFKDDYISHIKHGRCTAKLQQPVPCVSLCPAQVDIPGYVALIHEERYVDAVKLIRKDNPMPLVCGMICEHPCENRCRRNLVDTSLNIRALKNYAVEMAGKVPIDKPDKATGKRIAIIGGGPSGLTCAYYLSMMGHSVEIFEQRKKLGGMLRYGIPNYRLPREKLDSEIEVMLSNGVVVHTEVSIGKDISLEKLKNDFDAVYIAIGAQIEKKLRLDNIEAKGVMSAVELLRAIGDDEYPDFTGKVVSVIGGGNVAMDVARTSMRLGAKRVLVIYRRRRADMTALEEEISAAEAEGCELLELHAPLRVEKNEDGEITAVWAQPQLISIIKGDRPSITDADTEEVRIPTDVLITAVGQGIAVKHFEEDGIPVIKGTIRSMQDTALDNMNGIYAGGDCVSGPATVIKAIAAGKVAAANIDDYLGYNHVISKDDIDIPKPGLKDRIPHGRVTLRERDASERKCDFDEVEIPMSCEEAHQESGRCLRCDHFGYGVFKGGRTIRW